MGYLKPNRRSAAGAAALVWAWLAALSVQASPAAAAEDGLSRFWNGLEGYAVELVPQTPDHPQEPSEIWGIPAEVLQEYVAIGHSRWEFRPRQEDPHQGETVRADALQLLDPPGAFGLLTYWGRHLSNENSRPLSLPADNLFDGRSSLVFCKGSYLVRLHADPALSDAEPQLSSLAARLAEAVREDDVPPVTVINLPRKSLVPGSMTVYLGPRGLSRNPDFPARLLPLLRFAHGVEVTAARYSTGQILFLAGYPTPALAREAQQRLESSQALSGLQLRRSGVLLALATPPAQGSDDLLAQVNYNPKVQWIKDKVRTLQSEALNVYELLTNWVLFSLFYVVCIAIFGAIAGLGRYIINRRYPEFAARNDMVRLNLTGTGI